MSAMAITSPGDAREAQGKPLAGLVFAVRFHKDGSSEQLAVEQPPEPDGGWLWLHFKFLSTTAELPEPARALLVTADEHQQLQSERSLPLWRPRRSRVRLKRSH